jgi:hypothetical protein
VSDYHVPSFLGSWLDVPELPAGPAPRAREEVDARVDELTQHLALCRARKGNIRIRIAQLREEMEQLEARCAEIDQQMHRTHLARDVLYQRRLALRKTPKGE